MNILKVPTGHICIMDGEKGQLEFLSIADYGKEKNIKANFLGLTKEIKGVPHGDLLPLTEKWVVTISTQYGCSMGCRFCDVPNVGPGINATYKDLCNQIYSALSLHPEVMQTKRLNIHYARMGEPTFNTNVIKHARFLKGDIDKDFNIHPVVSTMMPKRNKLLKRFIDAWMAIKNAVYKGNAGLQLSINSTNEKQRKEMFNKSALSLAEIGFVMEGVKPKGRKITLNFALADNYEIDPGILLKHFSPEDYLCKITPMHITNACSQSGILTDGGYERYTPYKKIEADLLNAGYDVIVFVPSKEEDESRITCGNAILSNIAPLFNTEKRIDNAN